MINNILSKITRINNFKLSNVQINRCYMTGSKSGSGNKVKSSKKQQQQDNNEFENIDEHSDDYNPLYLDMDNVIDENQTFSTDQPQISNQSIIQNNINKSKMENINISLNKNNNSNNTNSKFTINNSNNDNSNQQQQQNKINSLEFAIGNKDNQDIENQLKPNLMKLFKKLKIEYKGNNGDGKVSDLLIDSLTHYPNTQIQSQQNKLLFLGELCFRHSISDPVEFQFRDKLLFQEFRETIKSQYFLRERCQDIGLSEFIRYSYHSKYKNYQSIYEKHYSYRCLIKFIGALYLETNFQTVRNFIHKIILQQPDIHLESFILNKPESILIKNFSKYKLESPIIKTFAPKLNFPFYTTIIKTGTAEVSRAYGLTKEESYNYSIEILNKKSSSFASLMSLILSTKNKV